MDSLSKFILIYDLIISVLIKIVVYEICRVVIFHPGLWEAK